MPVKPPPPDWPRMSSAVFYEDAAAAIDWLCAAFGFVVRLRIEDDAGRIIHSEIDYGEGMIMVSQQGDDVSGRAWKKLTVSPRSVGDHNTQAIMVFVDDVDAHCETARAHGASIIDEPATHDYGDDYWSDRSYGVLDCDGHLWWFTQRIKTLGK